MKERTLFLRLRYGSKIILYILFIIASNNIIKNSDYNPFLWTFILGIILVGSLFNDVLKYKTQNVMNLLAEAQDLNKINQEIGSIEQLDFLKGMKNSLIIPKLLWALDSNTPNTALTILNENEDFFRSKLDYLLIYRYGLFKAYTMLDQNKNALSEIQNLYKLKETNVKNKNMKLLFNWEQINALHQYSLKKYKHSDELYKKVNTNNYNPRELSQYYFERMKVYEKMNKSSDMAEKIRRINPNSPLIIKKETTL